MEQFQQKLTAAQGDARFTLWMEVFSGRDEPEARKRLDGVVACANPDLKILFANFLGKVPDRGACVYLSRLLEDENEAVRRSAQWGFERNQFLHKWPLLLVLLTSPVRDAKMYAMEKLSMAVVLDAMKKMLGLFPLGDEGLELHLLKCLRYFGDKRLLPLGLSYARDKREAFRTRALLILGSLYESGVEKARSGLLKGLEDPQASVRLVALWGLRKRPAKKDLKILFFISQNDPDPFVRRESLLEMAHFPGPRVLTHLLSMMSREGERMVQLKIEGIFSNFPPDGFLNAFRVLVGRGKFTAKEGKALALVARMKPRCEALFKYVQKELKRAGDEKTVISLLEVLGALEEPRGVAILEPYLRKSPLSAYAAMRSILALWERNPGIAVDRYLGEKEIGPLLKQMVMKAMLRRAKPERGNDRLFEVLLRLLKDENLNLRYLSAQLLALFERGEAAGPIAEAILKEEDPTQKTFLHQSLLRFFSRNPGVYFSLLKEKRDNEPLLFLLVELAGEIPVYGEASLRILLRMMGPELAIFQTTAREQFAVQIARCLAAHRLEAGNLVGEVFRLPNRSEALPFLMESIREKTEKIAVPWEDLEKAFREGNEAFRRSVVGLVPCSRSARGVRFLVRELWREANRGLEGELRASLRTMLRESAP